MSRLNPNNGDMEMPGGVESLRVKAANERHRKREIAAIRREVTKLAKRLAALDAKGEKP